MQFHDRFQGFKEYVLLRQLFDFIDVDGSGKISKRELLRTLNTSEACKNLMKSNEMMRLLRRWMPSMKDIATIMWEMDYEGTSEVNFVDFRDFFRTRIRQTRFAVAQADSSDEEDSDDDDDDDDETDSDDDSDDDAPDSDDDAEVAEEKAERRAARQARRDAREAKRKRKEERRKKKKKKLGDSDYDLLERVFNAITGAGADADGAGPMASRRDSVVQVTDLVMGLLNSTEVQVMMDPYAPLRALRRQAAATFGVRPRRTPKAVTTVRGNVPVAVVRGTPGCNESAALPQLRPGLSLSLRVLQFFLTG